MIGGWANTRVIIRRKQGDAVIRDVQQFDILDKDKPIVFLIQILKRKRLISNLLFFFFFLITKSIATNVCLFFRW